MHRFALVAILVLVSADHAIACESCVLQSLKRGYKTAGAVFLGEVESTTTGVARLKVLESFKGIRAASVDVATAGVGCPYPGFVAGERYIVFALQSPAGLVVTLCSHTNPVRTPYVEHELALVRRRYRWWSSPFSFSLPWSR